MFKNLLNLFSFKKNILPPFFKKGKQPKINRLNDAPTEYRHLKILFWNQKTMIELDDDVKEFLTQVYEDLEQLDRDLVEIEKKTKDEKLLGQIFRAFHTIKGDCGFFGFSKLGNIVHAAENLLSRVREGEIPINTDIITTLLKVLDAVRQILHQIETTGEQGDKAYPELKARLNQLKDGQTVPPSTETDLSETTTVSSLPNQTNNDSAEQNGDFAEPLQDETAEKAVMAPENTTAVSTTENDEPLHSKDIPTVEKEELWDIWDENTEAIPVEKGGGGISDSLIRVDVKHLDKLMNLVGELVLTRNQILQLTSQQEHTNLLGASQRLNLITSELQEGIMKTRMQPIKKLWDRFPRLVRDLSVACGKQVILKMEGEDTELDKTLIETISDPLTHLVRNAIDHGIESSPERIKKGKTAEGHLWLRAFHESGKVNIEVGDDGMGFNPEHLRENALQRGFITSPQAKQMSDKELFDLVFLPGFSTAKKVSDISGRGVGLDVVKTNMEKIGGFIDIQSTAGKGTLFKFKLPLTLAIIPALIVKTGGDSYAIPQVSLVELVRLKGEDIQNKIEWLHKAPVYRLRGQLLPLVYLNSELQLNEPDLAGPSGATAEKSINIIVLQAEDRHFGLVVDEVNDTQEIVVKPLGKQLKGLTLYAGATILGDGHVALILDIMALTQSALMRAEDQQLGTQTSVFGKDQEALLELAAAKEQMETLEKEMLLIFQISEHSRMAIPLSQVTRLEKFPCRQIEYSGNQHVIQYREQILPLVYLADILKDSSTKINNKDGMLQVVVHSTSNSSIGLVVPRILDIVEENITIKNQASRQGVLYSTVIQGKVTEMLDMKNIIKTAVPSFC